MKDFDGKEKCFTTYQEFICSLAPFAQENSRYTKLHYYGGDRQKLKNFKR
jgi:hypothetical protein